MNVSELTSRQRFIRIQIRNAFLTSTVEEITAEITRRGHLDRDSSLDIAVLEELREEIKAESAE